MAFILVHVHCSILLYNLCTTFGSLFLKYIFLVEGEMKLVLDGMQQMMEGPDSGTFDEDFFADLTQCFGKFDPQLMEAQDKAWAGMMEYAASGGQPSDEWLSCQEIEDQGLVNDHHYQRPQLSFQVVKFLFVKTAEDVGNGWYEFNCTVQELGGLSIYEPCYYASNMAYYHTLVELCLYNDWRVGDNYGGKLFKTYCTAHQSDSFFLFRSPVHDPELCLPGFWICFLPWQCYWSGRVL